MEHLTAITQEETDSLRKREVAGEHGKCSLQEKVQSKFGRRAMWIEAITSERIAVSIRNGVSQSLTFVFPLSPLSLVSLSFSSGHAEDVVRELLYASDAGSQ